MKIVKVIDTQTKDTPHKVDVKNIYSHDNAEVMHITLMPGESLKPHITPVDVFFYILEGTPSVLIGEEKLAIEKDSLVESPKDVIHSLYNETNSVARILVVKAPKPASKAKLV